MKMTTFQHVYHVIQRWIGHLKKHAKMVTTIGTIIKKDDAEHVSMNGKETIAKINLTIIVLTDRLIA